jgi:hypothetical protein
MLGSVSDSLRRNKKEVALAVGAPLLVAAALAIMGRVWGLRAVGSKVLDHAEIAFVTVLALWILTTTAAIVSFLRYRSSLRHKLSKLAAALYASDSLVASWVNRSNRRVKSLETCQPIVTSLLETLCEVVGTKVPKDQTGACFLMLDSDAEDSHFHVFAQVRHDHREFESEIRTLSRLDSCAGRTLTENEVLSTKDSTKKPSTIGWNHNYRSVSSEVDSNRVRYRGRVCAPVHAFKDGAIIDVGAICVDFQPRYSISDGDRDIMLHTASKIGTLCVLFDVIYQ